jgi:hypothetical protein
MPEQGRYPCGLTRDEVITLTDSQLVCCLYSMVDMLESRAPKDDAVIDSLYLFLDEVCERHVPKARWAEHLLSHKDEPDPVRERELEAVRDAMRAREGARILHRALGETRP